jgi:hypothetical protein
MNQTPLMAAAAAGNIPLTEALLERGADPQKTDQYGYNALHWAMRKAFRDPEYARTTFATLYELLAPPCVDVKSGERLVRLDRHLSEYFLFQTLWVLFKSRFTQWTRTGYAAFDSRAILDAWSGMPANVVSPERNRRQYLSGVLARNEVLRDYAYNRALFLRLAQGWYQFNPKLSVRSLNADGEQGWIPLYQSLNLPLIYEFSREQIWPQIEQLLLMADMPKQAIPVLGEKAFAKRQELEKLRERSKAHFQKQLKSQGKWVKGTKEALSMKIEQQKQLEADIKAHKESMKRETELRESEREQFRMDF